jgi:3-oxoacyl-[acyl-carrier-protein] synthase II
MASCWVTARRRDLKCRRNRRAIIRLAGFGASADATITAPLEDGDGARRSMLAALRDAGLNPEDVHYLNAHATSTPLGDKAETVAMKRTFGDHAYKLAISSTKSMTGHLLGAAGVVEAVLTLLAMRDQVAPSTINLHNPDPDCDLDFVPNTARQMRIDVAMSNCSVWRTRHAGIPSPQRLTHHSQHRPTAALSRVS